MNATYRVWDGEQMYYWNDLGMSLEIIGDKWVLWHSWSDGSRAIFAESDDEGAVLIWGTGSKDKNDQAIYEGDSILYDRNIAPSIDSRKYVVKWEDSKFVLTNSSETIDDFTSDIIEVIGNIFENPELLEDAE